MNNIITQMSLLGLFVLLSSILFCVASIEQGTFSDETYQQANVIVAYDNMGLKMCGRHCLYQDQCSAVNYNIDTLTCELLETGGTAKSASGSFYSSISTWTMDSDPCHPNLCTGKQKCLKSVSNSFYCQNINTPCDQVVCQHGATCKNGVSSFECLCTVGTFGTFCENNVCSPNPCMHSGICAPTGGETFQCTCTSLWSGTTCTESICDSAPCMNSGTCTALSSSTYSCSCATGFSGTRCQDNPCTSSPCVHGSCSTSGSSYICSCTSPYTGTNCDRKLFTTISRGIYTNNEDISYGPYNVGIGKRALVRFTRIDTENCCDKVMIYDGRLTTNPLLTERSGTSLGSDVITSGQYVLLKWITDHSVTKSGFDIQIYSYG